MVTKSFNFWSQEFLVDLFIMFEYQIYENYYLFCVDSRILSIN